MIERPPRSEDAARVIVRKAFALIGVPSYRLEDQQTGLDVADLLIAKNATRFWFLELKVDAPLSEGQREWLALKWQHWRNAYLLRYHKSDRRWYLWSGDATLSLRGLVPEGVLWSNKTFDADTVLKLIEETTYGKQRSASGGRGHGGSRTQGQART